tara:strand:+ start:587 stop:799 length:213 start_codon:yes stop_codon:yes gene_type:complete
MTEADDPFAELLAEFEDGPRHGCDPPPHSFLVRDESTGGRFLALRGSPEWWDELVRRKNASDALFKKVNA